jgi:hypothetical protein
MSMDVFELAECISENRAPVRQRICWTCATLFRVKSASDLTTTCPECQRRKAKGLPAVSSCRHKEQIVPISRLNNPKVQALMVPEDRKAMRCQDAGETFDPKVQALMVPEDRKAMRCQDAGETFDPKVQALMVPEDHKLVITRMDWMFFRSLVPRTVDLGTAVVDFGRCVIIRSGKKIKVTHQELRLLALLCHEVGSVVPFLILESQVSHLTASARRSVDTFKSMLTRKLGFRIGCISNVGLFLDVKAKTANRKKAA